MKNEDDDKKIIITMKNGEEKEGLILFTFESNGDDYVLYELDDNAYAAKIHEDDSLTAVNEDEWKLVESAYQEYIKSMEEEEE